jgi:histone H3/H4
MRPHQKNGAAAKAPPAMTKAALQKRMKAIAEKAPARKKRKRATGSVATSAARAQSRDCSNLLPMRPFSDMLAALIAERNDTQTLMFSKRARSLLRECAQDDLLRAMVGMHIVSKLGGRVTVMRRDYRNYELLETYARDGYLPVLPTHQGAPRLVRPVAARREPLPLPQAVNADDDAEEPDAEESDVEMDEPETDESDAEVPESEAEAEAEESEAEEDEEEEESD